MATYQENIDAIDSEIRNATVPESVNREVVSNRLAGVLDYAKENIADLQLMSGCSGGKLIPSGASSATATDVIKWIIKENANFVSVKGGFGTPAWFSDSGGIRYHYFIERGYYTNLPNEVQTDLYDVDSPKLYRVFFDAIYVPSTLENKPVLQINLKAIDMEGKSYNYLYDTGGVTAVGWINLDSTNYQKQIKPRSQSTVLPANTLTDNENTGVVLTPSGIGEVPPILPLNILGIYPENIYSPKIMVTSKVETAHSVKLKTDASYISYVITNNPTSFKPYWQAPFQVGDLPNASAQTRQYYRFINQTNNLTIGEIGYGSNNCREVYFEFVNVTTPFYVTFYKASSGSLTHRQHTPYKFLVYKTCIIYCKSYNHDYCTTSYGAGIASSNTSNAYAGWTNIYEMIGSPDLLNTQPKFISFANIPSTGNGADTIEGFLAYAYAYPDVLLDDFYQKTGKNNWFGLCSPLSSNIWQDDNGHNYPTSTHNVIVYNESPNSFVREYSVNNGYYPEVAYILELSTGTIKYATTNLQDIVLYDNDGSDIKLYV
jgi:hypothetical protein